MNPSIDNFNTFEKSFFKGGKVDIYPFFGSSKFGKASKIFAALDQLSLFLKKISRTEIFSPLTFLINFDAF